MRVALYIDDVQRRSELQLLLVSEPVSVVEAPSPEAHVSSIWIVDASDGNAGLKRLWSGEIPAHAWVLALVTPDGIESALADGADDVLVVPIDEGALRRRLRVATHQEERTAPLWRRRSVTDRLPGLVMQLDASGAIAWINTTFQRTLGYELREVAGRLPSDLVHPADAPLARLLVAEFAVNNPHRALSLRMRTRHGATTLIAWQLSFDLDGETLLAFGADRTPELDAGREANAWRDVWESCMAEAGWAALVVDEEASIVGASPHAAALWGMGRDELRGRPLDEVIELVGQAPWHDAPGALRGAPRERSVRGWSWPTAASPEQGAAWSVVVVGCEDKPKPEAVPVEPPPFEKGVGQEAASAAFSRHVGQEAQRLALQRDVGPSAARTESLAVTGDAPLVLIVDANDGVRLFLQRVARSHGLRTLSAASSDEAVGYFATHASEVDLVFLDVSEPEEPALRLLDTVVRQQPRSPVYLMSAVPVEHPRMERWVDRGAKDVYLKPLGLGIVNQTLQEALAQARRRSSGK